MRATSIGIGCVPLLYAMLSHAHHGNTEYDMQVLVRYEGTVLEQRWMNPHSVTRLATRTAAGKVITLEIEGGPPAVLRTGGVTSDSVKKGERVTAVVSPSRRFPESSAYGHEIIKADGTTVPLAGPGLRKPRISSTTTTLFGTWVPTQQSFSRMLEMARSWKLTEKGSGIRSRWSPLTSPLAQCIPMSSPMLMMYPVAIEIARSGNHVILRSDWMGAARTVYMDGRAHPRDQQFQQGHSVGRWEGNVLVVDSTNFADEVWAGLPTGKSKHLMERFALSGDGKSLVYSFEMNDPEHFAQPFSGDGELSYRPDLKVGGMECDREAASRFFRELQ